MKKAILCVVFVLICAIPAYSDSNYSCADKELNIDSVSDLMVASSPSFDAEDYVISVEDYIYDSNNVLGESGESE